MIRTYNDLMAHLFEGRPKKTPDNQYAIFKKEQDDITVISGFGLSSEKGDKKQNTFESFFENAINQQADAQKITIDKKLLGMGYKKTIQNQIGYYFLEYNSEEIIRFLGMNYEGGQVVQQPEEGMFDEKNILIVDKQFNIIKKPEITIEVDNNNPIVLLEKFVAENNIVKNKGNNKYWEQIITKVQSIIKIHKGADKNKDSLQSVYNCLKASKELFDKYDFILVKDDGFIDDQQTGFNMEIDGEKKFKPFSNAIMEIDGKIGEKTANYFFDSVVAQSLGDLD